MRSLAVCLVLAACGGHDSSTNDGNGDDGAGGDGNHNLPATVTVTLTNEPTNAAMFSFLAAYQDGNGAWQAAPTPTGDVYSFAINAPSWGFLWTCVGQIPGNGGPQQIRSVSEIHFAIAERTSLVLDIPPRCSDRNPQNVGLVGNLSNRSGGGAYLVQFGGRSVLANNSNGNYQMETPPGTHDLIVLHAIPAGGIGNDYTVDEVTIHRDVTVTAATNHPVDVSAGVATQPLAVTLVAGAQARLLVQTTVYTANGTQAISTHLTAPSFESDALDNTQAIAGDLHEQLISVSGNGQTATRTTTTATPADETWAAPAPLGGAIATVMAGAPYARIATTWSQYTGTVGYGWLAAQGPLTAQQCGGTLPCSIVWGAQLSPGVTGGSPGYTMPDLSVLPAWSTAFQLVTGQMAVGSVQAMTSTAGALDFPAATPAAAGTQRVFVRSDFTAAP